MRDAVLPLKSRAVTAVLFIVVGLGLASCGGGGGSGTGDVADKLTLPLVADRTYTANVAIADLTLPTAAGGTPLYTYKLHPAADEVSPNANGTLTPVPGLTFNPATRTLTGTPTTAGTYPLLYTATDAAGTAATQSFTLTVAAGQPPPDGGGGGVTPEPPTVMFASALPPTSARSYTADVAIADLTLPAAAGGTSPYTYKLHPAAGEVSPNANGTLTPAPGLTFDPAARTLTGAPTTAGTYPLLYTATDAAGTAATQSFTLTVAEDLTLLAIADRIYTENANIRWRSPAAIGGTAPYTYTLHPAAGEVTPNADGSLTPVPGLTFHPFFRTFVGQPTTTGTYPLIYTATDATGTAVEQSFTLTVADALTLPAVADQAYTANVAIADLTLPAATGSVSPYDYTLHPAEGEVSPNANGTITPVPGLTFDPSLRTLTGTPTAAGTYPLLYTATDTPASDSTVTAAAQSFTLTVAAGQPPPDGGGGGVTPNPPAQPVSCPSATSTDSADTVYRLTFQSRWTRANFPTNFPPGAHFSPLVGAVHDASNGFWDLTLPASPGIESMAETGSTGTLVSEINAVSPTTAYTGGGGNTTLDFRVNPDCPVVTFVSMLAPSHDWFVGVGGRNGFDLRNTEGEFVDKTSHLLLYDAGTEEGDDFGFNGATTTPQEPIRRVTTDAAATDFEGGHHRDASSEPEGNVATFKFEIIQAATSTSLLRLTAAPATIAEGEASTVTVALAEAAPAGGMPLTLKFAGTADGDDYRASAAAVTIPAGATTATFTMTALLDDIDDPVETIIITAAGATMTAKTTMKIEGEPAIANQLNRVILPEVARAISDHGLQTVAGRIEQARSEENAPVRTARAELGGQPTLADALRTHGQAIATGDADLNALFGDSDFVLPLDGGETGGAGSPRHATLWGGGDYRKLDGTGGAVDWDGYLFSAHVGADARLRRDLPAGLMVSWSKGEFDYRLDDGHGEYELDLTAIHPYLGRTARDGRLELWATAGYGQGDLAITAITDEAAHRRGTSDIEMRSVGVGGSHLLSAGGASAVRLKGELMRAEVDVEGGKAVNGGLAINSLAVRSGRARLALAATQRRELPGRAQLLQSAEFGARYDGGDGETGGGVEVGLGAHYNSAGLNAGGNLRTLAGRNDYREWGIQGRVQLPPGKDGQGVSFRINSTLGIVAGSAQVIWERGLLDHGGTGGQRSRGARIETELGYGVSAGDGLLTPYSRLSWTNGIGDAEDAHTWWLGGRLEYGSQFNWKLEGYRRDEPAETGAALQAELYW